MRALLLCVFAVLLTTTGHAATVYWTGAGGDALWSNPDNWSTGTVPGADDTAYFNSGDTSTIVDTDITVGALVYTDGYDNILSIQSPATLTVLGNFVVSWLAVVELRDGQMIVEGNTRLTWNGILLVTTGSLSTAGDLNMGWWGGLGIFGGAVSVGGDVTTPGWFGADIVLDNGSLSAAGEINITGSSTLTAQNNSTIVTNEEITGAGTVDVDSTSTTEEIMDPAAVGLLYFRVQPGEQGHHIAWRTYFERDCAGYRLESRAGADEPWQTAAERSVVAAPRGSAHEVVVPAADSHRLVELEGSGRTTVLAQWPDGLADVRRPRPASRTTATSPVAGRQAAQWGVDPDEFRRQVIANVWLPWITASAPRARMATSEHGVCSISALDLAAASIDTQQPVYAIFNGVNVPVEKRSTSPSEDVYVFCLQPWKSLYTPQQVVWFANDPLPTSPERDLWRQALDDAHAAPLLGLAAGPVTQHRARVCVEDDALYYGQRPFGADLGDVWFHGFVLSEAAPQSVAVALDQPSTASAATLRFRLAGISRDDGVDPDHAIAVDVNGTSAGTIEWDGAGVHEAILSVSGTTLVDGANTITLTTLATGAAVQQALLDAVTVEYTRPLKAEADGLTVHANVGAGSSFAVEGFSSSEITAWDVTAYVPEPVAVAVSGSGPFTATVTAQHDGERIYRIAAVSAWAAQTVAYREPVPDLRASDAEYVAIAPSEWIDQVQPLVDAHQARGLRARAVHWGDVRDGFGFGLAEPHALNNMTAITQPRYALICGSATYDAHDREGGGDRQILPASLVWDHYQQVPSDFPAAALDTSEPVAVGRLPAVTAAQLQNMVAKTLAALRAPYQAQRQALLVADDDDQRFARLTDNLATDITTLSVQQHNIATDGAAAVRRSVLSALGSGAALTVFVGHGAEDVWAAEGILTNADAASLSPGRPGATLQVACGSGYYASPHIRSLSEALLTAEGGPAAHLVSTGLLPTGSQSRFATTLMEALTNGRPLGEALLDARREHLATDPVTVRTFTVLGDPALRLPLSRDDLDADGLPNEWEARYGLDPEDPHDAETDPDNDGVTNGWEYRNRTNPMDEPAPDQPEDDDSSECGAYAAAGRSAMLPYLLLMAMIAWRCRAAANAKRGAGS